MTTTLATFFQPDVIGEPDPSRLPTLFRLSSALLCTLGQWFIAILVERDLPRSYNRGSYTSGACAGVGVKTGMVGEDVDYYEEGVGWSLNRCGIAGVACTIGYCATRTTAKWFGTLVYCVRSL
jgi:hypothetical protein